MLSATHNVIKEFPEAEYYISIAPITKSALDLSDEIKEKFQIKVSPQTIRNYRKRMPATLIRDLHKERSKNIESLRLLIEILNEQLKNVSEPNLKLKYVQEISRCIKEIGTLIDDSINYQQNMRY
jgi:hypothetical protein